MNLEQIIEAKTRVLQSESIILMVIGAFILAVALVLAGVAIHRKRNDDDNWDCFAIGAAIPAIIGLIFFLPGIMWYRNARDQAISEVAKYQLIEFGLKR